MALERLPIDPPLGAYLDALAAPGATLESLYARMADDPAANMMTHHDLGALLRLLVRATGGGAVLEIGTFVGTSAAWMAPSLRPGGRIDTLESDPGHADRAEAFFAEAGLDDRVRVHRGPALSTLPGLAEDAYDLCYIDADKASYLAYLDHAARLVRPGGMIVADNVLWSGRVARPAGEHDEQTRHLVTFTRAALGDPRLEAAVLPLGDGIVLAAVR